MSLVLAAETTWENCIVKTGKGGIPTLKCFEVVFERVVFFFSSLVIVVLFIMFVVGSISYLTSLGNPEKIKKSQAILKYALIGFFLFIGAFLILKTIDILFLGGQNEIFKFKLGP